MHMNNNDIWWSQIIDDGGGFYVGDFDTKQRAILAGISQVPRCACRDTASVVW